MQEKCLLESYMEEISRGTGKCCCSVQDTLGALDMGAVKDLIVWENLDVNRYQMRNRESGEEFVLYLTKEQEETKDATKQEQH